MDNHGQPWTLFHFHKSIVLVKINYFSYIASPGPCGPLCFSYLRHIKLHFRNLLYIKKFKASPHGALQEDFDLGEIRGGFAEFLIIFN